MQFSDLKTRTITASVIIGGLITLEILRIFFPSTNSLFPLIALAIVVGCSIEFVSMCSREGTRCPWYHIPIVLPSLIVCLLSFKKADGMSLAPIGGQVLAASVMGGVTALGLLLIAGRDSLERARKTAFDIFLGTFLFSFGGASLVSFTSFESHAYLYFIIFVVAAHDMAAYFAGKKFGKNKLSVSISPGKTIEGSIGGLLASSLVAVIGGKIFLFYPISYLVLIGVSLALTATLFDLGKSFLKRIYGVKDSGTILPGHGGLIDRLDGIFGGALAAQIFIAFFQ